MSAIIHAVRFHTRRTEADARAVCSCGWFTFGALWECQDAAAVHDIEWQAVEVQPPTRKTPSTVLGAG